MDLLSNTFAALADPSRRAILARLAQGEAPVGELARPLPISGPAVSRHLRVLEAAGLVERSVNARWRVCRLRGEPLAAAHGWLDTYRRFWEDSLDRLAQLLEAPPPPSSPPASPSPPPQPAPASPAPSHPPRPARRPAGSRAATTPTPRPTPRRPRKLP